MEAFLFLLILEQREPQSVNSSSSLIRRPLQTESVHKPGLVVADASELVIFVSWRLTPPLMHSTVKNHGEGSRVGRAKDRVSFALLQSRLATRSYSSDMTI